MKKSRSRHSTGRAKRDYAGLLRYPSCRQEWPDTSSFNDRTRLAIEQAATGKGSWDGAIVDGLSGCPRSYAGRFRRNYQASIACR